MKIIAIYIIAVLALVGLGYFLFQQSTVNPEDLPGQAIEVMNAIHIEQGLTDHPAYNSNPPTSGWHWPQPAEWGAYGQVMPDEQIIHNLEHGGIWISYQPDLSASEVEQLNDFAKRYRKVIVSPRPADETKVALAAWGHLQNIEGYDEGAILKFIRAFYDKGPEKVD
jgi:hypothetical protein